MTVRSNECLELYVSTLSDTGPSCEKVVCLNGGVCVEPSVICICGRDFTGERCETGMGCFLLNLFKVAWKYPWFSAKTMELLQYCTKLSIYQYHIWRDSKSLQVKYIYKGQFILFYSISIFNCCCWPDYARSQGISSNGIDIILLVFKIKAIKLSTTVGLNMLLNISPGFLS